MNEPSTGDWFQTYSGVAWDLLHPRPEDVRLEDLAHSLAHQCRYNGHCSEFYSVAEHSLRMAAALEPEGAKIALIALLHDAAEAYLGDMVRPLKREFPLFYEIERRTQRAIFVGLGLEGLAGGYGGRIQDMDLVMLATERRDLMSRPPGVWGCLEGVEPLPEEIVPLSAAEAKRSWTAAFEGLMTRIENGDD